jgi:hypothetical protein
MSQINISMLLSDAIDDSGINKEVLKQKAYALSDRIIQNAITRNNTDILLGGSMFSTYISTNNEDPSIGAVKYNHPIFNSTECEDLLVLQFNLSSKNDIIYVTNKVNATMNDAENDSFKFSAYDTNTGHKLDLELCNNTTYSIQMPFTNKSELNLTLYKKLKGQGIDIFNVSDEAFNSKCYTHIDNQTGTDTTLNWRKQNYLQKKVPMCIGINCVYQGISEFDYVQCNCTGLQTDNELVNEIVNVLTSAVSNLNIGIIFCYKQILNVYYLIILGEYIYKYRLLCKLILSLIKYIGIRIFI